MTVPQAIEWHYDVDSSRLLRCIAHGFVAVLGGSLLLVGGSVVISFLSVFPDVDVGALLLFVLLILVGGPFSLLYLWPMLTDTDQRPTPSAFTGRAGTTPWTARSVTVAIVVGALVLAGLIVTGVPFGSVYALVVLGIFSPVLVSILTTDGSIRDGELICNGTTVSLRQVTNVRSKSIGNVVIFWVTYAKGTGVFTPRLVTVPVEKAAAVDEALDRGKNSPSNYATAEPDRLSQLIICLGGVSFLAVAVVAAREVDDPVVSAYLGGILGVMGVLLCIAGWRGI